MSQPSYYDYLGISPWASDKEIRRAYRDLSKRYHPDTSSLAPELAQQRFQKLNEAYIVLSNPTQRVLYDGRSGLGRIPIVHLHTPQASDSYRVHSVDSNTTQMGPASYDITRRPLSDSEHFALFVMGVTVVLCLGLVAWLSWAG